MNKLKTITVLLLIMFLATINVLWLDYLTKDNKVIGGVYVYNCYIGGMTFERSSKKLKRHIETLRKTPVYIKTKGHHKKIMPSDLGVKFDYKEKLKKAFNLGHSSNFLNNFFIRRKIYKNKKIFNTITYDEIKLEKLMDSLNEKVYTPAKNAQFRVINEKVDIVPSRKGIEIDKKKFRKLITDVLLKSDNRTIKVPLKTINPRLTTEQAKKLNIKEKLKMFETEFDLSKKKRVNNIRLAIKKLDNLLLLPGQQFSFNSFVGPRNIESGYKKAPVFINKKLKLETGGGICQVTSTLYNLVLRTDLKVLERKPHSRPVGYVPMGLDATVYYNEIDFKFKNNKNFPILLNTEIVDNKLRMEFYGPEKVNIPKIKFETEIVEKIDEKVKVEKKSGIKEGSLIIEKGKPGYKVKVWKVIKDSNQKKLLYEDVYQPVETVLYIPEKE